MTNAQWMIENHMSFKNIGFYLDDSSIPMENFDRTKHYIGNVIKWGKDNEIRLAEYSSEDDDTDILRQGLQTLLDWLDKEHKEILTEDERWILSESIKPYKSRVISIHKTYSGPNEHTHYISVYYETTKEDQPYASMTDDAQIYEVKEGEGLQFSGMVPNVDYSIEELGLNC